MNGNHCRHWLCRQYLCYSPFITRSVYRNYIYLISPFHLNFEMQITLYFNIQRSDFGSKRPPPIALCSIVLLWFYNTVPTERSHFQEFHVLVINIWKGNIYFLICRTEKSVTFGILQFLLRYQPGAKVSRNEWTFPQNWHVQWCGSLAFAARYCMRQRGCGRELFYGTSLPLYSRISSL